MANPDAKRKWQLENRKGRGSEGGALTMEAWVKARGYNKEKRTYA